MNRELANTLKNKLKFLPFADLLMGIASTVKVQELDANNETAIEKRIPVGYDESIKDENGTVKEVVLSPDSSRKSIIYFEDFGITSTGTLRGIQGYQSNLRLICWLNRAKLVGDHYGEISGRCQTRVISLLCHKNPENIGMFTRLTVDLTRIPPQDAALFNRYTYNETDRQYLRPPFEFFGLDLTAKFYVSEKCLDGIPWNVEICH